MHKMIDPRTCINFRAQGTCPNWNQEIMTYLDSRVISDISLNFTPEMFDKAFEFCASCAQFAPFAEVQDLRQPAH